MEPTLWMVLRQLPGEQSFKEGGSGRSHSPLWAVQPLLIQAVLQAWLCSLPRTSLHPFNIF